MELLRNSQAAVAEAADKYALGLQRCCRRDEEANCSGGVMLQIMRCFWLCAQRAFDLCTQRALLLCDAGSGKLQLRLRSMTSPLGSWDPLESSSDDQAPRLLLLCRHP